MTMRSVASTARRCASSAAPRTLYDKIWEAHNVHTDESGTTLLYIDRHLVHEVTSPQAFEGLRIAGRRVRRPDLTLSTEDHSIPTTSDRLSVPIANEEARIQCETLRENVKEFGVPFWGLRDKRQGIVHIIGPEHGFTLPGTTVVCGDSHTSTHGAFGALAFGIGTSEVEHVLATQTIIMKKAKNKLIEMNGDLPLGVTAKDMVLYIIGQIGTGGGTGHTLEFGGSAVKGLSMEGRMTLCNMAIEAGARAGLVAPDDTTFEYIKGRPLAPTRDQWDKAEEYWRSLYSDPGSFPDSSIVTLKTSDIEPQVTWGTNPEMVVPITGSVPRVGEVRGMKPEAVSQVLKYMGLSGGERMEDIPVDKVFIGSCTNGRIEDLHQVAEIAKQGKVSSSIKQALVVPGSGRVKKQAEDDGTAQILIDAGFEWREPGCSMCLGMNDDRLDPYERCASTSNRNFEGRQGARSRTHLVSPAMAAAAALTGRLTDVRKFQRQQRAFHTTRPLMMQPFTAVEGIAAPIDRDNVDTDLIIPKQFLRTIKRTGLGKNLFDPLRYNGDGTKTDFVLNLPPYDKASIIVAGDNFGCGSSREHAPWALLDFGIRCVISTGFADIFFNNCFKNGILPVVLQKDQVDALMQDAKAGKTLRVDLKEQKVVRSNGESMSFNVDPFRKHCLVNGLDDIQLTLEKEEHIQKYEAKQRECFPWLSLNPARFA